MKRRKVITILQFFRTIDEEIQLNKTVVQNLEERYYITLGAVSADGLPHGKGGVSKPVENIALNVPEYVSEEIERNHRRNKRLEKLKISIRRELDRLNYHEKAVITWFYMNSATWEQISERINYSPRQCRNIRDRALDRLGKWFSENEAIFKFNFPEK